MPNSHRSPRRRVRIRWMLPIAAFVATAVLLSPSGALAQDGTEADFSYDSGSDAEGWTFGFADPPLGHDQSIFELDHGHRPLPDALEGSGVYVQGHNRSDDLFIFLKKQVGGLRPNTRYAVSVSLDLATNVPTATFGIGGSPGESVFVKAGASTAEPVAEEGRKPSPQNEHRQGEPGQRRRGHGRPGQRGDRRVGESGVPDQDARQRGPAPVRGHGRRRPGLADRRHGLGVRGPERLLPGIGHQAMVVKEDADTVGIVLWQHPLGAPCFRAGFCSKTIIPDSEEHPLASSRAVPKAVLRWIRA